MKLRGHVQLILLTLAVMQAPLLAQNNSAGAKGGPMGELPAARGLFRETAAALETEITERALARTDATGYDRLRLETGLDLRLLGSWLASARGDDELLANAYLRGRQLAAATHLLEAELTDARLAALTPAQKEGLKRLHDLTFGLAETSSLQTIDTTCREVGLALLQAVTPQSIAEGALISMRPKTVPPAPNFAPAEPPQPAVRTEQRDPESILPRLNVSARLRQQLLQMQAAMRTAERNDPGEAAALRKMLHDAVDLAAGFSANAAVDSEERLGLEQQLSEAMALFVDPRTRSIAKSRVDGLGQYRGLVQTISELNLSPQSFKLLSPAFRYVQRNPNKSVEVLNSVKQFVDMAVKYEALPGELSFATGLAKLPPVYQEARKAFENHRNLYLGAVEGLEATGLMAGGPEALPAALQDMRQSFETLGLLAEIGPSVEALNTLKPKPAGALEKRLLQEAMTAATGSGPARGEAAKFIGGVIQLAQAVRELPTMDIASLPAEALEKQGVERVGELQAKARDAITAAVTEVASGGAVDAEKLRRHKDLPKLLASLKAAGTSEGAFGHIDLLSRWADWDGDRETVAVVMSPYLSALNAAVAGYLADSGEAIRDLPQVEYATYPLRTLLVRDLLAGPELSRLPSDLAGACHKLATPSGEFATERYTSFGMVVWARARLSGDLKASETALKLVCKRIATDLNLKFDEKRATFAVGGMLPAATAPVETPKTPTRPARKPPR